MRRLRSMGTGGSPATRVPRGVLASSACLALLLAGCGARESADGAVDADASATGPFAATPSDGERARELEWDDLLAPEDRSRIIDIPEPLHTGPGEVGPPAEQIAGGEPNRELHGRFVRLPGFVVPLELDERGRIVEFLLAPYVGACIHVPAPPPTQIVHVRPAAPVEANMYDAYWIVGRMEVAASETSLARTSYSMRGAALLPYG